MSSEIAKAMQCTDCVYLEYSESAQVNTCHRYPPTMVIDSSEKEAQLLAIWTICEPESDIDKPWCGEFTPKQRVN